MRKYLNRGLLYREFKNLVGFLILNCLYVFVAIIYPFLDKIKEIRSMRAEGIITPYDDATYNFSNYFSNMSSRNISIILMIIAVGTVVIGFDLMGRKCEVLSSMPYKKEEIIINKWFSTLLVVIIPLSLGFLAVNLIYLGNRDILRMYMTGKMIFTWSVLNILVYIFVLTFIMFIQSLSGKNIIGGIIGGIFLIFPMGITALTYTMIHIFARNPKYVSFFTEKLDVMVQKSAYIFSPVIYNKNKDLNCGYDTFKNTFISIKFRIIILIIITIVVFILMVYASKKYPLEKIEYIVVFKPLEKVFKIGASISFGFLGGSITSNIVQSHYRLWGTYFNEKGKLIISNDMNMSIDEYVKIITRGEILTVLIAILCGCIAYLIINKIIEMNKK